MGDCPADSAPRFFVTGLSALGGASLSDSADGSAGRVVALDRDQSRHAQRVLRLEAGDPVQLLDGQGHVARAKVAEISGAGVSCVVESVRRVDQVRPQIILATAIPKGPRGDAMANDLAQLGADVLVPMRTARSVVHPGDGKLERYRKQSAEAGKQCGRAWWMAVAELTAFDAVLSEYGASSGSDGDADEDATLRLLANPAGEPTGAIASRLTGAALAVVLVGPEGGFTPQEIDAARDAGFVPWRFAPHILRVETAAAAAVAVLRALA
ncbi:RsmE family RNA methyltransferase [Phycisphaeraceae bacterium D3-23]